MKNNKPKYKLIIDAAVDVIAENGYHASQVSKIAKKRALTEQFTYISRTKRIFWSQYLRKKWDNLSNR